MPFPQMTKTSWLWCHHYLESWQTRLLIWVGINGGTMTPKPRIKWEITEEEEGTIIRIGRFEAGEEDASEESD